MRVASRRMAAMAVSNGRKGSAGCSVTTNSVPSAKTMVSRSTRSPRQ
ncbi:Uncharacterised protein [Mycobacteroides abscessus subsp. abscessus]|nr:Uncharacterised protein [Mycobacteroides abscessus subsp. abscessus]